MTDWLVANPLATMYGPYFLAFYAAVSAAALWTLRRYQRALEPQAPASMQLPREIDPYEVAFLRDGAREMAQVAVFSLQGRGWIDADRRPDRTLLFSSATPPQGDPLHPAEEAVLRVLASPMEASEVRGGGRLTDAVEPVAARYRARAEAAGLVPTDALRARQRAARNLVLCGLLALAAYKVAVALSAGRTNVGILIVMAVVVAMLARGSLPRAALTPRGEAYLDRIRSAFHLMRYQASGEMPGPGIASGHEATLVAASFGVAALWGTPWMRVPEITYPPPRPVPADAGTAASSSSSSTDTGTSSDSSSSSDGGSSCGSSCGGGGCGGCGS